MITRPDHGARFVLDLASREPEVTYAVRVLLPDRDVEATATIAASGEVTLAWAAEPEAWVARLTKAFLRSVVLGRDDGDPWPTRLVRWRAG